MMCNKEFMELFSIIDVKIKKTRLNCFTKLYRVFKLAFRVILCFRKVRLSSSIILMEVFHPLVSLLRCRSN
jgi:hypothetical protein